MVANLKFTGFSEPTTTDTPNDLFDVVLPRINNLAELKVVLYVIRRTFGYHKQFDWISLSQFENGIVTQNGKRLDNGVGLSRKSIVVGLERAVNNGYLDKQFRCPDCNSEVTYTLRVHRKSHASKRALPERCHACGGKTQGRVQTFYGLAWSEKRSTDGVVKKSNYPSVQSSLGVVTKLHPQTTTTTTTTEENIKQIAVVFANAIGAERYEPTEKEIRRIAALLAEGFSPADFEAGIQHAIDRAKIEGKQIRSLAYCFPVIRAIKAGQATDRKAGMGTPAPITGMGQPQTVIPTVPSDAPEANTEWRELLDLVQTKNPTRQLDRADVRTWTKLVNDFTSLAHARNTSPIGLVMEGVLEAVGANSNRSGYLAPNLVRRILENWQRQQQQDVIVAGELPQPTVVEPDDPVPPRESQFDETLPNLVGTENGRSATGIWEEALGELQGQMTKATFNTWLRPTKALGWQLGTEVPTLVIHVQSAYAKEWLEARLHATVQRTVAGITGQGVDIHYIDNFFYHSLRWNSTGVADPKVTKEENDGHSTSVCGPGQRWLQGCWDTHRKAHAR